MKKLICTLGLMAFLFGLIPCTSWAARDDYPSKRIEFIVPTEAGGDGDILARKLLEGVSARLGQPIVVVNKSGAAGAPGYRDLHGAKPDGYTIGLGFPTLYTNKMQGLLPWDQRDFTMIAQHGTFTPIVIGTAKTDKPLKTLQEAISYGKSHPGELKFALSVVGGSWWVAGMLFQNGTKVVFKNVPQEGSGAVVITQLAGGHTDIGVAGLASALSQIDAGNLRFLATFGQERMPGKFANVPTLTEAGYDVTWDSPNYVIGPPRMPKNVTDRLQKAVEAEANKAEFKAFAVNMNATPVYRAPDALLSYLNKQQEICRGILRNANLLKEK